MEPRLKAAEAAPEGYRQMINLDHYVKAGGLEESLLELVKIRSSQINHCAYCIDMHTKDARAEGEGEQRIYALDAWRETPFFTDRERAALAWTEALTLISINDVPDDLYQSVRKQFTDKELVDLTLAVIVINGWNRLSISFRTTPGSYQRKNKTAVQEQP